MAPSKATDDLAGLLYDATIEPDGLEEMLAEWNARIGSDDPEEALRSGWFHAESFMRHVERAHRVLDEVETSELRGIDELLAGIPFAAIVLTDAGVVSEANAAARSAFGLFPGGSIRLIPAPRPEIDEILAAVAEIAAAPAGRAAVLRFTPHERNRPVLVHLRGHGHGRARRHVVAVCSELGWSERADAIIAGAFGLTGAETALVRRLAAGDKVRDIALDGGRAEGTVRSQLHSVLGKVGVASQGELVRMALTLLNAAALDPGQDRGGACGAEGSDARRSIKLADGRCMAVLRFGDPAGRPVLWLMSSVGLYQPTTSGERELRRRGRCVIVPIRAGYGASDPPPQGRNVGETALADLIEVIDQLDLARCPVVAPFHEIRTALALAKRRPGQVERVIAVAPAFPTSSLTRFRRLRGMPRVFIALLRFAPHLVPFVVRTFHNRLRRAGLPEMLRNIFSEAPGDVAAFADREIAEAVVGAFTYSRCTRLASQDAFVQDAELAESPWPDGLGRVDCPVLLFVGEQDCIGPAGTAREMAAENPGWRYVGFHDAGQLVCYLYWLDLLAAIDGDGEIAGSVAQAAE